MEFLGFLAVIAAIVFAIWAYKAGIRCGSNGPLGGVCEGLGRHFDLPPNALRVAIVASTLLLGVGPIAYIVMWVVLPTD